MSKNCADCNGEMKKSNITTEGIGDLYIDKERDGGILDSLGIDYKASVQPFVCKDCGLIKLYVEDTEQE